MISALILTKDEEDIIEDTLLRLDFVDEIIILDQKSKDKTIRIAKKFTEKIFISENKRFDINRNTLAQKAKFNWLLYIDADEKISKELKKEILSVVKKSELSAYYIPRKNYILGKFVKHSGLFPDYVPRLFKKNKLVKWEGEVHESPRIKGEFGYLKNYIFHQTARDLNIMLKKSIKWAEVEANLYHKAENPRVSALRLIYFSLYQFLHKYFYKRGFLDGKVGFIYAMYQGLHSAMILTYLWEIQNDTQSKFKNFKKSLYLK